jgi:hypothetical protein
MQKVSWFAGCALSLGLGLNVASASVVTVNLTGHVTTVNDPSSAITVGEPVTASYSYDTSTAIQRYALCAPSAPLLSMSVSVGGLTVQMHNNDNCMYLISIFSGPTFGQLVYDMFTPGQIGPAISVRFYDFSGQWPASVALPTNAPPMSEAHGDISVTPPNSSSANVFSVQVDSATLAP